MWVNERVVRVNIGKSTGKLVTFFIGADFHAEGFGDPRSLFDREGWLP